MFQAIAQGSGRFKTEIPLKRIGISKGDGYVAGLHRDQFLMRLNIKIHGENACTDQFLTEDPDKVQQVFRMVVADVVKRTGRHGKAVIPGLFLRRSCMQFHGAWVAVRPQIR